MGKLKYPFLSAIQILNTKTHHMTRDNQLHNPPMQNSLAIKIAFVR